VDRGILDLLRLGQAVSHPQAPELVACRERLERLARRAGIDEQYPVRCSQAEVQAHVRPRDLGEHHFVVMQQSLWVTGEPPDRRVHRGSFHGGTVALPDADTALAQTIAHTIAFWSSEDPVLRPLYGAAAVDPAAQDLVDRQRADRRRKYERLVRNLHHAHRLRSGLTHQRALNLLLVLSSYNTYRELRAGGLSDRQATALLQENSARAAPSRRCPPRLGEPSA
jgi:hypothetical protein